jgi:two-component system, chemotaxis family, protein-glutamate methylesterase/glutaminase
VNDARKIRVLIVDDSAIVRKILSDALSGCPDIEVVGTAPDPYIARNKIIALHPDVLTLDIEMPRMDGLTFLPLLMRAHPMPVIVISSLGQASCHAALEALRLGAVEVLAKPGGPYSVGELKLTIAGKVRSAAGARVGRAEREPAPPAPVKAPSLTTGHRCRLIAIGASTGGTEAIPRVLAGLPPDCPPILIVQHIPAGFSRAFADRLDKTCPMRVREAVDGDLLETGLALVAPGNFHLVVRDDGSRLRAVVKDGPTVCYQRPSVDVGFQSVAALQRSGCVAALLTGMGSDGARGMLALKQAGAHTIAQDESSCIVFGMPREAIRLGGVDQVLRLERIPAAICAAVLETARAR